MRKNKKPMDVLADVPTGIVAELGKRIRSRREAIGLSQTELGVRLGKKEKSAQKYVSRIERGEGEDLSGDTLLRLPEALNCDGHWLRTGEGDPERRESVGWKLEAMREILDATAPSGDVVASLERLARLLQEMDNAGNA